jgi:hypothetical protein
MLLSPGFQAIGARLGPGDDVTLWEAAWDEIVAPIESAAKTADGATALYLQMGSCSHWLRPHQTRLAAGGGFAWPSGYLGGRYSRLGLPELDWHVLLRWAGDAGWAVVSRFAYKRRLVCRVAVPNRTARHGQAVIHVRWEPGTVDHPRQKATRYYAFRRRSDGWVCEASDDLYNHGRHN